MIKTSQLQQRSYRWLLAALISAGGLVALVALLLISPWSETKAVETETGPAEVQPIEGTELSRVVLTEQAARQRYEKWFPTPPFYMTLTGAPSSTPARSL